MHQISRHAHSSVALLALLFCLVAAPPALAETHRVHLGVTHRQFCPNPVDCAPGEALFAGKATSNLDTGVGTINATIDFSPAGPCNTVSEIAAFLFEKGTILTESQYDDCAIHGLRIDTTFKIVGGTGAFKGATGGGREFSAAPVSAAIIYNGTISF